MKHTAVSLFERVGTVGIMLGVRIIFSTSLHFESFYFLLPKLPKVKVSVDAFEKYSTKKKL